MFARPFISVASVRTASRVSTATTPRHFLQQRAWTTQTASRAIHTARNSRGRLGWQSTFRRAQARGYRRQAFNYQTFQGSKALLQRWAARPTFAYEVGGLGLVCGGFYVYNLEEVPVSGRRRFNVMSPELEQSLGRSMYDQTMEEFASKILPPYAPEHRLVQRVLDRLIPASGLQSEDWEIHVIDDPMQNAFVVPGGKVFVFKGILGVCQGEDGLAAVLGHEIAHNVAHHAAERMSQGFVFLPLAIVAFMLVGLDTGFARMLVNYVLTLPGSRRQEAEADYIGLLMMAESCYDPAAAVALWGRMAAEEKNAPPEFLSTHPNSGHRQESVRSWLPQAEQKREASGCGMLGGVASEFWQRNDYARL